MRFNIPPSVELYQSCLDPSDLGLTTANMYWCPTLLAVGSAIQQDVHVVRFARDVVISFASFMAAVFGHYRQYLKPCGRTDSNDDVRRATFDIDGFIELRDEGLTGVSIGDVQATRRFLQDFRCSQMFEHFCRSRESLGIPLLQGNSDSQLEGNVFETLVQQSALRIGEPTGDSYASLDMFETRKEDGSTRSEQDDQLTAAELRAKSAAATDLFLASGLVAFYRVNSRALIRSESARDSEQVGILEEGEIIKVMNLQTAFPIAGSARDINTVSWAWTSGGGAATTRRGHARAI